MQTRTALVAPLALAFLLAAVAPGVGADHAYSHRYVVFGVIVDEAGAPVADAIVSARPTFGWEGECAAHPGAVTDAFGPRPEPRTNARGEFWSCFHAHGLDINDTDAEIRLIAETSAGEVFAAKSIPVDPWTRVSYVDLEAPVPLDGDAAARDAEHLVVGRVWAPWASGEKMEQVPVEGTTVRGERVDITILDDGREYNVTTTTNGYGDFAVRVPLGPPLGEGARVLVRAGGVETGVDAGGNGWTHLKVLTAPRGEFTLVSAAGNGQSWWQQQGKPSANPELRVLPGANVTLTFLNGDGELHNIQVEGHAPSAYLDEKGAALAYNFTAPQNGTLEYWCVPHKDAGMKGRIVVVPQARTLPPTTDTTPTPRPTATPPPVDDLPPPTPTHADPPPTGAASGDAGRGIPAPALPALASIAAATALLLRRRPDR